MRGGAHAPLNPIAGLKAGGKDEMEKRIERIAEALYSDPKTPNLIWERVTLSDGSQVHNVWLGAYEINCEDEALAR